MIPHPVLAALVLLFVLSSCAAEPPAEGSSTAEPPAEDPPLVYVSLGDSLAAGAGASDPRERGYSPLYRDLLEEETGREVRLIGLGVSGETSESFVTGPQLRRAESVLAENPGAVVTISLGANDLLSVAEGTGAEREETLARYARNLDYILRTLAGASDPAPGISVLALYNPAPGSFTDEWTGRLNAETRRVAEENAVSVAAGDEAFRDHREEEYTNYARYQDIHPTDEGYEALARAFAEV